MLSHCLKPTPSTVLHLRHVFPAGHPRIPSAVVPKLPSRVHGKVVEALPGPCAEIHFRHRTDLLDRQSMG
jgi:hypothetical protein